MPGVSPGANGQGETIEETKDNLRQAVELIVQDRMDDYCRVLPEDAFSRSGVGLSS